METLTFERDGRVGWLRLNRPEKLNAMTGKMWAELRDLGAELVGDPELRCLVVTGNGRAFSAGIDTSQFGGDGLGAVLGQGEAGPTGDPVADAILRAQEAYTWLEDAPFATVAAVRGYALGAGLQLAMACDIRVVAEEAGRIGLAERVVDDDRLDEEVGALALHLAAQPPIAARWAKRAIDAAALGRDASLRAAAEGQAACLRSRDFGEAITAFLEGRAPVYEGR